MMKSIKTILINASAAKTGGAETILRTLDEYLKNESSFHFVIISPIAFETRCEHIEYVNVSTTGLGTIYFTIWGIRDYIKKYKPIKLISFNNLNYVFNVSLGITYFHQTKALDNKYKEFKLLLYRFVIRNLIRKNVFIVQSDYIKGKFLNFFNFESAMVLTCWPGFTIPNRTSLDVNHCNKDFDYRGFLPIAYNAAHKNVMLLNELQPFLLKKKILITTLLNDSNKLFDSNFKNIISIGSISRSSMFSIYDNVDFLVFTSKDETVGLPIFEFLQTGKPAFVYAADYAVAFYEQFNKPINFILFKDAADFERLFSQNINVRAPFYDYSKGEWDKIIDLL